MSGLIKHTYRSNWELLGAPSPSVSKMLRQPVKMAVANFIAWPT